MKRTLLILAAIGAVIQSGWAQGIYNKAGGSSNLFLRAELSARATGVSGAYTAMSVDENAIFYNPAGLANIRQTSVGFNHAQWFEDIKMDNIVLGYNYGRTLGMALSISHMWMPTIQGRDYLGQDTENIDVSSTIMQLGFGYRIHPSFFLGTAIKYFSDNLATYRANGIAVDVGFYMHTILRGVTVAGAMQNIGSDIQYDNEREQIPLTYRTGVAYKVPGQDLQIAFDAVKSRNTPFQFRTGVEYVMMNVFALRVGNQFLSQNGWNPTAGAGIYINDKYLFDYAFFSNVDFGATHRVGFSFKFNMPGNKTRWK